MLLLVLLLCSCLHYPSLHGRCKDANISQAQEKGNISFSCACIALVYTLVSCAYGCAYAYACIICVNQPFKIYILQILVDRAVKGKF